MNWSYRNVGFIKILLFDLNVFDVGLNLEVIMVRREFLLNVF